MFGCPDGVVHVNTSYGADYTLLDTTIVPIHAYDPTNYMTLEVNSYLTAEFYSFDFSLNS